MLNREKLDNYRFCSRNLDLWKKKKNQGKKWVVFKVI